MFTHFSFYFIAISGSHIVPLRSTGIMFLCLVLLCFLFLSFSTFLLSVSLSAPLCTIFSLPLSHSALHIFLFFFLLPSFFCVYTPHPTYSQPGVLPWLSTLHKLRNCTCVISPLLTTERDAEFKVSPFQQHSSPKQPSLSQRTAGQTPAQPEPSSVEPAFHATSELSDDRPAEGRDRPSSATQSHSTIRYKTRQQDCAIKASCHSGGKEYLLSLFHCRHFTDAVSAMIK